MSNGPTVAPVWSSASFSPKTHPAPIDLFAGVRKHGFHSRLADASPDAFCHDQTCCHRPASGQRECGNGEHVDGIPRKCEPPMPTGFVGEISRDRTQSITHELAETCDKPDDCSARA